MSQPAKCLVQPLVDAILVPVALAFAIAVLKSDPTPFGALGQVLWSFPIATLSAAQARSRPAE